ncbi:hypothetical protein PN497_08755 [Sphaerospermopsis kisseleviana CS-549]|uniref:Transposase n=1 Tax=Sphaerospermopsis kisseleviana CS-549 TaxID=3021783 RepID=A0ABT4ZQK2_9CYAN|nr:MULTISPECIES: hypothetical protein [Sphaerospermopsis]MDB9441446.1 hypothetical protein [Sphaerospermopsis kisseleviana CS-549]
MNQKHGIEICQFGNLYITVTGCHKEQVTGDSVKSLLLFGFYHQLIDVLTWAIAITTNSFLRFDSKSYFTDVASKKK